MQTTAIHTKPAAPLLKQRFPGEVLFTVRRNPIGLLQMMANLGDCSYLTVGPFVLYMINHPELIKELLVTKNDSFIKGRAVRLTQLLLGQGLLTSEGAFHRRQRKLVLPAFHHSRLTKYAEVMAGSAEKRNRAWRDGQELDIEDEMMHLTLEIVAKTLFDADVENESDAITQALTDGQNAFEKIANPFSQIILHLPLPVTRSIRKARRQLDTTIFRFIEDHRQQPDREDLLSMLLEARDEETGEAMKDEQVRDEAMTLFAAGHETTAIALTWTWYLLARHREIENLLHQELATVLGGRTPAFSDLNQLIYTRQVLSEALRLYPPAWALNREAAEEVKIGDYLIPKGATVDTSPYILHRDARFWPNPEQFDPERFSPENKPNIQKFTFMPFSFGIRGCIGEQFAWTEALLVLATIAQKWKFRLLDSNPIGVRPLITLRPANAVRMQALRRGG